MRSGILLITGIFTAGFLTMNAAAMLTAQLAFLPGAILISASVLAVLLLLQQRFYGDTFAAVARHTGLHTAPLRALAPGVAVSAALLLSYPLLGFLIHATIVATPGWPCNLAGLFLTGGIAEEALFRGFLFARLRRMYKFRRAALISMGFFTLAHLLLFTYFDWPLALISTVLAAGTSIPLAYLYERGGNTVWSGALAHTTIRTIGMVFTADQNYPAMAAIWIAACLIVPYLVLVFYRNFRQIWQEPSP